MGETIKIKVCPLSGEEFELNVSMDMRVENFKQKVADKLRTDTDNIRILLKDKLVVFFLNVSHYLRIRQFMLNYNFSGNSSMDA